MRPPVAAHTVAARSAVATRLPATMRLAAPHPLPCAQHRPNRPACPLTPHARPHAPLPSMPHRAMSVPPLCATLWPPLAARVLPRLHRARLLDLCTTPHYAHRSSAIPWALPRPVPLPASRWHGPSRCWPPRHYPLRHPTEVEGEGGGRWSRRGRGREEEGGRHHPRPSSDPCPALRPHRTAQLPSLDVAPCCDMVPAITQGMAPLSFLSFDVIHVVVVGVVVVLWLWCWRPGSERCWWWHGDDMYIYMCVWSLAM